MKIRFNLLPESQKEYLRTQKNLRTVMEQEIYMMIVFGILVLSLFAMYFLLKTEAIIMKKVESDIVAQSGYEEVLEMHKQFTGVHAQMDNINSLSKSDVIWSKFFSMLSDTIDENIVINSLKIEGSHASMAAVAGTREDVVSMKEQLGSVEVDGKKCFENITVPEANLAVPKNVSFSVGLDINLACLK